MTHPRIREIAAQLTKTASNAGLLIDIGWRSYKAVMYPHGFGSDNEEMLARYTYYSGAQHLYASILTVLDDDADATPSDLARMDAIHKELTAFEHELTGYIALHRKPKG